MKLNYKEFGSGRPMIIIHGLLGSLDNWQSLAKRFAEDYHVFTLDQRNHGQSPHCDDMDYDLMTADLEEFISEHNIVNPILIGHSMGGKTVMKFALEHPEKVSALIPVDMSPRDYPIHHQHIIDALDSIDFNEVKSRKDVEKILIEKLEIPSVVAFLSKNVYWREKEKLDYRFNLNAIENNIDLISAWPVIHGEYTGPTLFIKGNKADYVTDIEPNIEAYFPNARIVGLHAGHWVHAEQPDEFYQTVIDFLKK